MATPEYDNEFLIQFFDSMESLPPELRRNLKLTLGLEGRAKRALEEMEKLSKEYLEKSAGLTKEEKKAHVKKIHKLMQLARDYADDKVEIAKQSYALVNVRISRMDRSLAQLAKDMEDGPSSSAEANPQDDSPAPDQGTLDEESEIEMEKDDAEGEVLVLASASSDSDEVTSEDDTASSDSEEVTSENDVSNSHSEEVTSKAVAASPDKEKVTSETIAAADNEPATSSVLPGEDQFNIPVEPNEPFYCICDDVYYGSMIACDDANCDIEWFHLDCMELPCIPKGKWYCPNCVERRRKTKRSRRH